MSSSPECLDLPGEPPRGRARRRRRLLFRCLVLAAMVLLLTGLAAPWPFAPLLVPALSPYLFIVSALAGRTVAMESSPAGVMPWWSLSCSAAFLVGLPVIVLALVSRRWFCRHACPVGLCTQPLFRLRPSSQGTFARLPHLGRWIALATLAGAVFGYPVAMWLDPLAIFSGMFTLRHHPASLAGWAAAGALALIATSAAWWPHAWCLRLCPLGATQDLLTIGVLAATRPGRFLGTRHSTPSGSASRFSRRTVFFLGAGALAVAGGAGVARWARTGARGSSAQPIRPPGAAGAGQFPWLCVRCGNCLRACPEGILQPDVSPEKLAGYLAPVVRFGKGYCKEDCRRCTEVCPSGAIAPLTLEAKPAHPMGLAKVDMSLCLLAPENGERECAICRNACPYQAIKLEFDYDTYVTSPRVNPQLCPGCGACEVVCPGTNEAQRKQSPESVSLRKAIYVVAIERA